MVKHIQMLMSGGGGEAEQNKSLKGQRDEEARDPSGREVGGG